MMELSDGSQWQSRATTRKWAIPKRSFELSVQFDGRRGEVVVRWKQPRANYAQDSTSLLTAWSSHSAATAFPIWPHHTHTHHSLLTPAKASSPFPPHGRLTYTDQLSSGGHHRHTLPTIQSSASKSPIQPQTWPQKRLACTISQVNIPNSHNPAKIIQHQQP